MSVKRCVVYLRVSTPSQTIGSGLSRQLDECIKYARSSGLYVAGVFGDCCSGDGPMPNRSLAYVASKQLRCPILVDTLCRWSRMTHGSDPLVDADVIVASPTHAAFRDTCERICQDIAADLGIQSQGREP